MGLINWVFDIYQHSKIDDARRETSELRSEMASLRNQGGGVNTDRLEDAIGSLALATKTLQRMLIEKGVCTQSELSTMLNHIDAEDGLHDGKAPLH
ncbi:MAG: hypothetical protein ACI8X5_003921 [Planctomycetota bacterium]|jgi:hypothetical protein